MLVLLSTSRIPWFNSGSCTTLGTDHLTQRSKVTNFSALLFRAELAEHGFRFCVESLEAKLVKHKTLPEDMKTGKTGERWTGGTEAAE